MRSTQASWRRLQGLHPASLDQRRQQEADGSSARSWSWSWSPGPGISIGSGFGLRLGRLGSFDPDQWRASQHWFCAKYSPGLLWMLSSLDKASVSVCWCRLDCSTSAPTCQYGDGLCLKSSSCGIKQSFPLSVCLDPPEQQTKTLLFHFISAPFSTLPNGKSRPLSLPPPPRTNYTLFVP